ncbi:DNA topoisomerase IV, alpha subunit [Tricholoma matsutake]|nr:DNA topoisomerase IV, alpha subunit [Tricholoma matsutake 945]
MGSAKMIDNESVKSDPESEADGAPSTRSCEAIERIEDMVTSLLTQLAFSGRSTSAHSISDDDPEPEVDEFSTKVLRGKSKIELQLADRSKRIVLGFASLTGNTSTHALISLYRATNYKYLKYPRKSSTSSAKPFAQLFRVLDIAHEAITYDIPITKRDIYYKDVALFKHQRTVDNLVDDLAATFELERSDLHIRATSKGLICGAGLTIHLITGETVKVNDTEGVLIPVGEDIASFSADDNISWVLIVEKEAVFQTLCRLRLTTSPSLPGHGLIITGKGYPDIATRHLVKTLSDALPLSAPVLALVDGDPYGIDILSVYKYGSRSLQHESTKLAAGRIKWLGLWSTELDDFGIDKDRLLPITKQDEKKALSMLQARGLPRRWRKELTHMLHSRRKAEIEILATIRSADIPQQLLSDRRQQREDLSTLHCSPYHDAVNQLANDRTDSQFFGYSSTAPSSTDCLITSIPISPRCSSHVTSPSSSSLTMSPVYHSTPPPHASLLWYLTRKIADFVAQAEARAIAMGEH